MNVSEKVKAILTLNGKKLIELADYFGMTRQSMSNKVLRESWSAKDLVKVAAFVDCDLSFEMKDGQRIYLFSQADKDRFGPPVPKMDEVTQIGDDLYIDARGNTFSGSTIRMNAAMGGGLEIVSADMFDDPIGTKEDARSFSKLDKRAEAIQQEKLRRGEYSKDERGAMIIPPVSEADRPDDISVDEWHEYLKWTRQ